MEAHGIRLIDVDERASGVHTITGVYNDVDWYSTVTFDGQVLDPKPSQKVYNHSPTGFAWGYSGSGPTQLALAILLKAGLKKEAAIKLNIMFRDEFISRLEQKSFTLKVNIREWVMKTLQKEGWN